ncbi:hypothetical protein JOF29_000825 [Kribbella aluminosa]|uniref:Uncharacterized protein n=1 Tax=Kribbella aluminosa TaxID=416017 RepID=A0ABS4UDM8_9ACTN|nr:hypothetical protein [Kribbella aluminosa]MBP2349742.1 hypothetical protein [Kribbella aluminosa]
MIGAGLGEEQVRMDGQQADGAMRQANAPTAAEIAKLREFLGVHTDADRPGVYKGTGERPDNVRPLARPDRTTNELD